MTSIVSAKVSGVRNSRVEFEKDFIVAFGDGLLKSSLPKVMDCPWEELRAFPTLDAALNSDEEGALLMDVVGVLGTDNIGVVLRATGFEVDEVKRTVNLYVFGCRHVHENNPSSHATSSIPNCVTPSSDVSRNVQRETLSQDLKLLTKKLVCDIFPRDDQGVFLCAEAKDPALRRPAWLMDELFRKLSAQISAQDAKKCLKYCIGYVRRNRLKQIVYASNNGTELERNKFKSEVSIWLEGPYGKAWQAGVRDRPSEILLTHLSASTSKNEKPFERYSV